MNAVTASDLEAADLLALARLDDDGSPCPSGLPQSQPGRPGPDNDRRRATPHPGPVCAAQPVLAHLIGGM
jgi:hypothetical protein